MQIGDSSTTLLALDYELSALSGSRLLRYQLSTIPDSSFQFGANWRQFLRLLDEDRIAEARRSLHQLLGVESLDGKRFLDVGCGSGLFSLAARRDGATVRSFDYDGQSVACAQLLKDRYFPQDEQWIVEQGSVLDREYLRSLGTFDYVYSWGVLHHTGAMWQALDNVRLPLARGGMLGVSIYNDQQGASRRWRMIKRLYNRSPDAIKLLLVLSVGAYFESRAALIRLIRLQNPLPFGDWAEKKKTRGMSVWYDLVDWVGGYPFEVAKPEQVFEFYRDREFELLQLTTQGAGHGCNEFVLRKRIADSQRMADS